MTSEIKEVEDQPSHQTGSAPEGPSPGLVKDGATWNATGAHTGDLRSIASVAQADVRARRIVKRFKTAVFRRVATPDFTWLWSKVPPDVSEGISI